MKTLEPYPITRQDIEEQLQETMASTLTLDEKRIVEDDKCEGLITRMKDLGPYLIQHT